MNVKKPKIIILNITERCNSRCVMCGIWKKKNPIEINSEAIENFFKKNKDYLDEVKTFGLTGGEPLLAQNYLQVIKMAVKYLPALKSFGHPTNALLPDFNVSKIREALKIIPKNVFFGIGVSLDGIGKKQEEIRGIKNYFKKSKEFIEKASREFTDYDNFYVSLTTTLSKNNLDQVEGLSDFASKHKLRITFRPAMTVVSDYINNKESKGWQITQKDKKKLKKVFQNLYGKTKNDYYDFIVRLEEGAKRDYPCPFIDEGFVINPDGKIQMCLFSGQGHLGNINEPLSDVFYSPRYLKVQNDLIKNICSSCSAECHTVRSSNFKKRSYLKDQLEFLIKGEDQKFESALKENKNSADNSLLKSIAFFSDSCVKSNGRDITDEEKIVFNTKSGKEKFKMPGRNGIKMDFQEKDMANLLLNLAKYYYIIKIYSKAEIYLDILREHFSKEFNNKFKKELNNIENRIKLA